MIAQWNLARFAEALLPLFDEDVELAAERVNGAVEAFAERFDFHWTAVLKAKLGLVGADADARALADDYLTLLHVHRVDFTLGFARLADAAAGHDAPLHSLFGTAGAALTPWLQRWRGRIQAQATGADEPAAAMRRVNPVYIPRNHQVEAALDAAVERDDLAPFERLLQVLEHPFEEQAAFSEFAEPAPPEQTARHRTFCGT